MTLDQVASMELLRASSRMIQRKLSRVLSTPVDRVKTHDMTERCPCHPQNDPQLSMRSICRGENCARRIGFEKRCQCHASTATTAAPFFRDLGIGHFV